MIPTVKILLACLAAALCVRATAAEADWMKQVAQADWRRDVQFFLLGHE